MFLCVEGLPAKYSGSSPFPHPEKIKNYRSKSTGVMYIYIVIPEAAYAQ